MNRMFPATLSFVLLLLAHVPAPVKGVTKASIDIEPGRGFWSFQPLKAVAPPQVKATPWVRTDIDRFILAPLQAQGLAPNDEANRRTLVRRVYFDLWGLPPEPAEVEAFVADPSPDAYEHLIDRLLAGSHYGERWARHWLDLARFAESNGYAFDQDRAGAFHYRDFVIKALNEGMPYDQFVRLQIAGDQIAPESYMAQAATGFLAAGPFTSQQTQKERERSRYEQLDDVVGTIGTSMLGLTVGCARCHDHKYDPLTTHDYYRFVACFAETGFQDFDHDPDTAGTRVAKEKFDAAHKSFVDARVQFEKDQLSGRLDQWLATRSAPPSPEKLGDWQVIGPFGAADFKKAFEEAFAPEKEIDLGKAYDALKWTPRPEWKDGQVHNTLTGDNSANYLYRTIEVGESRPLEISLGRDDAIKVFLNGKQVYALETSGGASPDQDKVTLQLLAGANHLLVKIVNSSGPSGFYFSTKPGIPKNIQDIFDLAADKRNDQQKAELAKWYAPRDADWSKLNLAEQEHLKTQPTPAITKVFAARKGGATYNFGADTRKVYFLERGNSYAKQELATPGFLSVLETSGTTAQQWLNTAAEGGDPVPVPPRVALASWLTDLQQGAGPLLARVIVNRLWQHHMSRGIVATPSDLGSQGTRPTHPELLDFLAVELVRGGWKLKPIHKQILMSAVYRQSGETNAAAVKADPENGLWWRHGTVRLEAEVIRDTLLAVSGSLDKTMFGMGSLDQASPRRSIYLTVKRSNLVPMLQLFDAPDSIQSIGHRIVTTVPPQALAMMNSALARQLAEKFVTRIRPAADTPPDQVVEQAYALALSRPPTVAEKAQMVGFINGQTASYGGTGNAADLAVADFCQLMLCLNEFIFVD
ncbi:MAG: DUF1549 and DUF1553 domain-containing protein [Verrucomicrobia bacterium]|nr:DUF1549 and DUF1553 domain-containing protein [Verrucomicrobiota bacterium]